MIGLGAYGDGAVVIGEVLVIDGGEPPTRIAAVPAVVHAGVDELDILLLQRPCDGGGQTGALVQILQMPGIGNHGGGAAVPDLGKETVGGELASDGVHQTAVALHLHLQGQVGAGGQLPEAALLGEALALRQVVQHHGDGIGAVGDVDFGAGELHPPGGVALCVRHRHIEVQGVTGRVTGDLQQQTLLVDDLHLGGQLAVVLAAVGGPLHGVGAVFHQQTVVALQQLLHLGILRVNGGIGGLRRIQPAVLVDDAELGHAARQNDDGQTAHQQGQTGIALLFPHIQIDALLMGAFEGLATGLRRPLFHLFCHYRRPPLMPRSTPPMARRYIHGSSVDIRWPSSSAEVCSVMPVVSAMVSYSG